MCQSEGIQMQQGSEGGLGHCEGVPNSGGLRTHTRPQARSRSSESRRNQGNQDSSEQTISVARATILTNSILSPC